MARIATATLLLGLAAGFAFAVAMELVDVARAATGASGFVIGVLATSVPIACFGGALLGAPLAEIVGRRWSLVASAALLTLGSALSALAGNVSDLAFGRIVLGAGIGLAWVAAPMMLSETARAEARGARITLFFVGWGAGILLFAVAHYFTGYAALWRQAFWAAAAVSAVCLPLAWRCPPSPSWLFLRGDNDAGRAVLDRLGWPKADAEEKAGKIAATVRDGERLRLLSPAVRPVLLLGAALMLMDQVTGSSNILFNQSLVAGLDEDGYQLLVAGANLVTTLAVLALIDRLGRRFLLLLGLVAAAVAMPAMAAALAWIDAPLLQGAIVAASAVAVTLSLGPIAVVLICELMPLHVRAMGIPILLSLNFLFDAPVIFSYQAGVESLGRPALFLAYGLATLVGLLLLWRVVPEPRGLSLEHVERYIRSGRPLRLLRRRGGDRRVPPPEGRADPVLGSRA